MTYLKISKKVILGINKNLMHIHFKDFKDEIKSLKCIDACIVRSTLDDDMNVVIERMNDYYEEYYIRDSKVDRDNYVYFIEFKNINDKAKFKLKYAL